MTRIIVCDDEPHIVEGLRFLLRRKNRRIDGVSSGKEALRLIEDHPPDLLITDIMMPEMSGLELIATLRDQEATKDLPVIILTAKGEAHDAAMSQEVWGALVVAKPFEPKKVRELVDTVLENRQCPQPDSI
jgi:DNA-binding response OmpR family regulator